MHSRHQWLSSKCLRGNQLYGSNMHKNQPLKQIVALSIDFRALRLLKSLLSLIRAIEWAVARVCTTILKFDLIGVRLLTFGGWGGDQNSTEANQIWHACYWNEGVPRLKWAACTLKKVFFWDTLGYTAIKMTMNGLETATLRKKLSQWIWIS